MKFNVKLIKHGTKLLIASAITALISLFFFLMIPLNLSIDFKGGELLQIHFTQEINKDRLNSTLESLEGQIPQLNNRRLQHSEGNTIVLRLEPLSETEKKLLMSKITESMGENEIVKNDTVGPTIGKELAANAMKALGIGSILIIIYVTFRFEFIYAIAGLVALLHDVIITTGLIALFRYEINTPFIAAILTILGYSINDTIVVFDRIRENEKKYGKNKDYGEIIEESVNQVIVRSLYTSITTVLSILMLLLFGGATLKTFSMALFIGMIVGTYSSVFLVSPMVYALRKFRKVKHSDSNSKGNKKGGRIVNGYDESDKVLV